VEDILNIRTDAAAEPEISAPEVPVPGAVDADRYRRLVEAITDYAIYMLDAEGRVSSWNPGAQRLKGYSEAEVLGSHFSRFYTDEDRAGGRPARALATAASEGRFEGEGWRVRKDGARMWAHVIIDPIRDETGGLVGFAKITRDITERREAQAALELAREQLFQAQKLEAIGQLTGGVAHDFNNLLTAILGSLELVKRRLPHDPRVTPLIDNAIQGAERGATLTQRMLAFARRQELKLEAVEIASLVRGMTGLLERSLGPSIRIETRFPRSLPPVKTDPNQLENALLNLTVNARDAMPHGGTIRITAKAEAVGPSMPGPAPALPPGGYVRLSVCDEGDGMDTATLARASEPFFTTKGIGKGTGLGLSMVHGLAEQSGGRLAINSRPGVGTTVDLWLPEAPDDTECNVIAGKAPAEARSALRPLSVLAVDDDSLVLLNTVTMLEDLGHQVFSATSASEALAVLRRDPVDLVISDYAMPQVNGVQLAQAIHAEQPALPVILATGYAELAAADANTLPRLAKPFLQDDLANAMRAAMELTA
jgi:PAS domain S-box-containing protein